MSVFGIARSWKFEVRIKNEEFSLLNSSFELRTSPFPRNTLARAYLSRRKNGPQVKPLLPQHRLPEVSDFAHPVDDIVDAEVLDAHSSLDLFPRHRCGDRSHG